MKRKMHSRQRLQIAALEDRLTPALAFDPAAQTVLRDTLLSGVASISDYSTEGIIAVYGDHVTGIIGDANYNPIVAAMDNGPTRAVLAAKYEFANFGNFATADTQQFYLNVMNWLAQGEGTAATIVTDLSAAKTWLNARGYGNVTLTSNWETSLGTADILLTYMDNPSAAKQTAAINFLTAGGNLYAGANGWSSATPGGNNVLRTIGLSWTTSYSGFDGSILRSTAACNAVMAADVLANTANYSTAQQVEATSAIKAAGGAVPATDPLFAAIRANVLANTSTIIPSPATPVSDAESRTKLNIEAAVLNTVPVNQLFEHRTAGTFGTIPAGSPRVTATTGVAVSTANAAGQWLSTGLYAAPGEVVTVTVPSGLVNAGWKVKVASHTDDIYKPVTTAITYSRMPTRISRDFDITATSLSVGSVFGGLLYLVKPATTGTASYSVTFANAVEAPTFILGTTTDTQWVAGLRDKPAPYAELRSGNLIITLHSADIRTLSNPTSVMQYWNERVAAQDYLVNSPNPRTYPERINDDLQISAGWMHSGYPVMAYANNLANMVDSDPSDDWGFVHEFGHNRQSGYWTFSTEGEVTNNVLGMYAYDSASGFGNTLPSGSWGNMWSDAGRAGYIPVFISNGRLRDDAGAALVTYAQLRAAFGWAPFEAFFRQYQTAPAASLPANDLQERDQWVTRFSGLVGKDLSHFFQAWGFNPSASAMAATAALPDWSRIEVNANPVYHGDPNAPLAFNVSGQFTDIMVGTAGYAINYTATTSANGTLINNGNGSFIYTPNSGWEGRETLQITASNSFGGVATASVTLDYTRPVPRSHWKLNEATGTAVLDSSGNNHTGTAVSPAWSTGVLGTGALTFNGSNRRVTFGTGPALSGSTDFTVAAWIKTTATASGVILQQRDATGFNGQYRFRTNANGTLQFMVYGGSAYQFDFASTATVNNGVWRHVAAARQGSIGIIYIDGVPSGTASGTVRSLSSSIGVGLGADIRDSNSCFNGTIDEARIYDSALSVARIGQIASLTPTGITSTVVNDGTTQRSRVQSITVAFNGLVSLPANPASALSLTGGIGLNVDVSLSTSTNTILRLTFTDAALQFGSLADGRYSLSIFGDLLTDSFGAKVDADNNGAPGGTRVANFHRLFGDYDGNATVDATDLSFFPAFGAVVGSPFDFNNNGDIDSATDLAQFGNRFGLTL